MFFIPGRAIYGRGHMSSSCSRNAKVRENARTYGDRSTKVCLRLDLDPIAKLDQDGSKGIGEWWTFYISGISMKWTFYRRVWGRKVYTGYFKIDKKKKDPGPSAYMALPRSRSVA